MNALNELSLLGTGQNGNSALSPSWGAAPFMSNDLQSAPCLFRCSECPVMKNSCEDLEIHIKLEHLNWLPFQCLLCSSRRASDNQIREHVISHHKVNDYRYTYVDNPNAKRVLQGMIDRSLTGAIQQMVARRVQQLQQKNGAFSPKPANGVVAEQKRKNLHDILSRALSHENEPEDRNTSSSVSPSESTASATATVLSKNGNLLNDNNEHDLEIQEKEIDFNSQLSSLFGNNGHVSDKDDDEFDGNVSSSLLKTLEASMERNNEDVDPATLIQNVSSLFNVNFNSLVNGQNSPAKPAVNIHGRVIKRRPGTSTQCVSKKRVLGECTKCQKPVTAGARQMHMFFHLGKDENTYRFKCKFDGCDVEHYRKDQMENHMSKQHGRIDHDMMIDRSAELYDRVQKLSMELLGTVGNHPGPNAARAQAAYNKMQAEKEETRKRKMNDDDAEEEGPNPLDLLSQVYSPATSEKATPKVVRPGNEENLECLLCHKFIVNRTRGFHILWHLCNDLGIIRYCCRLCDYKHERPQSVSTHGKKEHGREDVVEDSLNKYEEEVKSMSKACFGLEQLFSKESRRRKVGNLLEEIMNPNEVSA
uniref:C2H2-type domain-containing protein n=1 Tax=Bursaphelenchus xylophilus TaxID=6326 RepID=A0A1I7SUT6_BURXY